MHSDFPATEGLALHWLAHFIFLFHLQYNDVILEKEKTVLLVKKKKSVYFWVWDFLPLWKNVFFPVISERVFSNFRFFP